MKKNVCKTDKIIRWIISFIFIALFFSHVITGTIGIILLILAGIFILTSLFGFCPLYLIFGFSSCKNKEDN